MLRVLNATFVQAYYRANTGFFLFFFFVFFGAVQGGALVSYHLSLMKSILGSHTILLLVFGCWTAYHVKCTTFFLAVINAADGNFLYNLQATNKAKQFLVFAALYTSVYLPVLLYALLTASVGFQKGYVFSPLLILAYQALSITTFIAVIHHRLNNWINSFHLPSFSLPFKKAYLLFGLYYLWAEKKNVVLLIKVLSLSLLYLALVWNGGPFKNDSFILFYLLIMAAHAVLPYLSVQFAENRMAFARNLPLPLYKRAVAFLLPYALLVIPETAYLFAVTNAMPVALKAAYIINIVATLALLTAITYSEAQSREEYGKAVGGLLFISVFVFHVQAFWPWIAVQLVIASVLFVAGYYKFERAEET